MARSRPRSGNHLGVRLFIRRPRTSRSAHVSRSIAPIRGRESPPVASPSRRTTRDNRGARDRDGRDRRGAAGRRWYSVQPSRTFSSGSLGGTSEAEDLRGVVDRPSVKTRWSAAHRLLTVAGATPARFHVSVIVRSTPPSRAWSRGGEGRAPRARTPGRPAGSVGSAGPPTRSAQRDRQRARRWSPGPPRGAGVRPPTSSPRRCFSNRSAACSSRV